MYSVVDSGKCHEQASQHVPWQKENWNKASFGHTAASSQKLVYFGQEDLLETLTTARNCFITPRFVLIGTSEVAYFAHCQSFGMCCSPAYTHTRATPQPSGVGWKEGGVNDLTEDSVELTPATEQTICSFHQQLWSKKKKIERNKEIKKRQGEDGKRWVIRRARGGALMKCCADAERGNYRTLDCGSEEMS